jgi:hypothetical protein
MQRASSRGSSAACAGAARCSGHSAPVLPLSLLIPATVPPLVAVALKATVPVAAAAAVATALAADSVAAYSRAAAAAGYGSGTAAGLRVVGAVA